VRQFQEGTMIGAGRRSGFTPFAALAGAVLSALLVQGAAAQGQNREAVRALTGAYNASGQELFRRLSPGRGNVVFSPYSIGTAMAMALAGARGETEREMAAVLKHSFGRAEIADANSVALSLLNGYDQDAVPPSCPQGMRLSAQQCEQVPAADGQCKLPARRAGELCVASPILRPSAKLLVANALMLANAGVSKDYAELLKDKYAAELFQKATLGDVNSWVSRKTEGKIEKILDRMSDVVLINAVYFKARWASVFNQNLTRTEAFNLSPSQQAPVPMMQQRGNYSVVARQGYRAIRLPYEVQALGLVIVLPDAVDGLSDVTNRLDADELSQALAALRSEPTKPVALAMPRFKSEFKADLREVFQQSGMTRAFILRTADFSGMTGRRMSEMPAAIDQIVHRAVIDVMEGGTEAAAATAVGMRATTAPSPSTPFRVDHPFLYFIVDDASGAILFQGRVVDPR
jgi:serine protease inhibitor